MRYEILWPIEKPKRLHSLDDDLAPVNVIKHVDETRGCKACNRKQECNRARCAKETGDE